MTTRLVVLVALLALLVSHKGGVYALVMLLS